MTAYRGRPVGYRPWPGRLYRAAVNALGWLLWAATAATIGAAGGIAIAIGLVALLIAYLGTAGPVEPTP